jgi:DNA-binding MarR family transcriptional regulator
MSNNYSYVGLQKAKRMGYITRKKIPKPEGQKGNDMIVNSLTPKGRALLETLIMV